MRDWKGKSHRVMIMEEGFGYDGRTYSSLSEIARLITGTRWNGPRFFGLRRQGSRRCCAQSRQRKPARPLRLAEPVRSAASAAKRMRAGHGL